MHARRTRGIRALLAMKQTQRAVCCSGAAGFRRALVALALSAACFEVAQARASTQGLRLRLRRGGRQGLVALPAAPVANVTLTAGRGDSGTGGGLVGGGANGTGLVGGGANGTGQQGPTAEGGGSILQLQTMLRGVGVLLAFQLVAVAAFEARHRQWAEADLNAPLLHAAPPKATPLMRMFDGLPQLVEPYLMSSAGQKGRIYASAVVSLGAIALSLSYVFNAWQREFWDNFQNRDAAKFPWTLGAFAVLISAWVLNDVYSQYIRAMLYINWRTFMTHRFVDLWLGGHAHFFMQLGVAAQANAQGVDNPDQRIQEDVHLFVSETIGISYAFLSSFGKILIFVPVVLVGSPAKAFGLVAVPGWLVFLAMGYSLAGTLLTHCIGGRLIDLSFARQRYEADFRHLAVHVRDHAESITLYASEANEGNNLRQHFERIKVVWWQHMMYTKRLSFFTLAYDHVQRLVPFFILAPSYFAQEISMGELMQLTGAIGQLCTALDWFINVYGPLTDLRATADRLLAFEASVQKAQECSKLAAGTVHTYRRKERPKAQEAAADEGDGEAGLVCARLVDVAVPGGRILWKSVNLDIQLGQKVLISGPEGAGKSVLFKALAGIWPYVGSGQVRAPLNDVGEMLFVPQRPALPKNCSLRDAISYPEIGKAYSEAEVLTALQQVGLQDLLRDPCDKASEANAAGLNRVCDWSMHLSPGMQQRLAVGHVLLRRPHVLFLDEVTSNVSAEATVELYRSLVRGLPEGAVIVSISHDVDTLLPFHDVHYRATKDGEGLQLQPPVAKSYWTSA